MFNRSGVFIVNFEHIFLVWPLNKQMLAETFFHKMKHKCWIMSFSVLSNRKAAMYT